MRLRHSYSYRAGKKDLLYKIFRIIFQKYINMPLIILGNLHVLFKGRRLATAAGVNAALAANQIPCPRQAKSPINILPGSGGWTCAGKDTLKITRRTCKMNRFRLKYTIS